MIKLFPINIFNMIRVIKCTLFKVVYGLSPKTQKLNVYLRKYGFRPIKKNIN